MRRALVAVLAVISVAGCSQTAALAPVGGAQTANLRYAVNDVLGRQSVGILVAPVCTGTGGEVRCEGRTVDGRPITATATAPDASTVRVSVGESVIYDGSVQDVLDAAGTEPR